MKEYLVWLDLETTGLNRDYELVLEIAVCVTKLDSFEPLFTLDCPLRFSRDSEVYHNADEIVRTMHENTGLWTICETTSYNTHTIDEVLAANFIRLGLDSDSVCYPAGSNPKFGTGFCEIFFPKFFKFLSHKSFDVRALKIAHRIQRGEYPNTEHLRVKPAHRAWNDVVTDMNEAAFLLGFPPIDTGAEDVILLAQHLGKQL
jgi:oligoribonuclease (3'-5' exoribonuclease)